MSWEITHYKTLHVVLAVAVFGWHTLSSVYAQHHISTGQHSLIPFLCSPYFSGLIFSAILWGESKYFSYEYGFCCVPKS